MIATLNSVIRNTWPTLVIILTIAIVLRLAKSFSSKDKFQFHEEIFNILFIAYILILFELLTFTESNTPGFNLVPFQEILRYDFGTESFYIQVVGNILVFLPFGYYVGKYTGIKNIGGVILISAVTSSVIETVQFFIGRSFDIDDIILNTIGCIFGFLLFVGLNAIKKKLPDFLKKDIILNILSVAFVVIIVLYFLGYSLWG